MTSLELNYWTENSRSVKNPERPYIEPMRQRMPAHRTWFPTSKRIAERVASLRPPVSLTAFLTGF
jgi:hypothetical protein